jgi:hypothetical protein
VQQSSSGPIGDTASDGEVQDQETVDGRKQGSGRVLLFRDGHVHSILGPGQPAARNPARRGGKRSHLRGGLPHDLHV